MFLRANLLSICSIFIYGGGTLVAANLVALGRNWGEFLELLEVEPALWSHETSWGELAFLKTF